MREQGFKSLRGFLENLEKASENPEIIPELEAKVKAGAGKASYLSSEKVCHICKIGPYFAIDCRFAGTRVGWLSTEVYIGQILQIGVFDSAGRKQREWRARRHERKEALKNTITGTFRRFAGGERRTDQHERKEAYETTLASATR